MKPLRALSAAELVSRMPARARRDLLTWRPDSTAEEYMRSMLSKEITIDSVLSEDTGRIITDEKPYNEYYLLRRISEGFGSSLSEYAAKLIRNPLR
jgi:spermidine synthase